MAHAVLLAAACYAQDLRAALSRQTPSFQYSMAPDRAPSEVTRSACNGPRLLPHARGVSCSFGRMLNRSFDDATVMQIVICDSHAGRNRPFSSQISPDQGILCISSSRELTEILPSIRNSAAQLGRCQPRRCEAFLRLARSYRVKAIPRQSRYYRNHRGQGL
jgi:hypothetical protein